MNWLLIVTMHWCCSSTNPRQIVTVPVSSLQQCQIAAASVIEMARNTDATIDSSLCKRIQTEKR